MARPRRCPGHISFPELQPSDGSTGGERVGVSQLETPAPRSGVLPSQANPSVCGVLRSSALVESVHEAAAARWRR
jgi:hypothetical protein